ncbi:hypothetical protein [Embleya sp. AB8]|uniref:hypothetical protein n=1 Tax=Embleya sp. AB8 TaxID=3156304 RepID=UPI003C76FA4E
MTEQARAGDEGACAGDEEARAGDAAACEGDAEASAVASFAELSRRTNAALAILDASPAAGEPDVAIAADVGRQIALALADLAELLRRRADASPIGAEHLADLAFRGAEIQRDAHRVLAGGRPDEIARHTDDHRHNVGRSQVVVVGGRLDVVLPDGTGAVVDLGVDDADSTSPGWTSWSGDHPAFDIDRALGPYDHLETQTALDTLGRVMTRHLRR